MALLKSIKKAVKKTVKVAAPLVKPLAKTAALAAANYVAPGSGSMIQKLTSGASMALPKAAPVQRPANAPVFAGAPGQTIAVAAELQSYGMPTTPPPSGVAVVSAMPGGMSKTTIYIMAAAAAGVALLLFLRK